MGKRQERRAAEIAAEAAALADEAMVVWRVHSWYRRGSVPVFGAPLRCPDCGAFCLVLKVDSREGVAKNRCTECNRPFLITERAVEAVVSGRMPRPDGVVFPGDLVLADAEEPEHTGAVFGAPVEQYEPVTTPAPVSQVQWTPPVLEQPAPAPEAPPVAWTPPVIDRPSPAVVAPPPAAVVPPPAAVAPPPVVVPAPPPPPAEPPEVEVVAPTPEPDEVDAGDADVDGGLAASTAPRTHAATRAAEAGRRNRRLAAAARRARVAPADDEVAPADAPEPIAPTPVAVDPPPVPAPSRSSSLFSAEPPPRPDGGGDGEVLPALAPLLQTVAVGGRLVTAEATGVDGAQRFGAVLVTTVAGGDARLVTPGAPAAERVDVVTPPAAPSPPPVPTPDPVAPPPPSVNPPPALIPRAGSPLPGLPTRERREALRVLMVEDDPADAALAQALFEAAGSDTVSFQVTTSRQTGMEVAAEFEPHVVLLDLDLPDSHGLATITRWCFSDLPGAVVVMSGEYSPVIEQQGREQGVSEFLPKAQLTEWLERGEEGVAAAVQLLESLAVRAPIQ